MKNSCKRVLIICAAALVLAAGCATSRTRALRDTARVYQRPYDEVWGTLKEYIVDDLGCVPVKISKRKGIIRTDWVTLIDTHGTARWMISAEAEKKKNGVRVIMDKKVQAVDEFSKNIARYKKDRQQMTPKDSSWKTRDININGINELYSAFEKKLRR
jgi:hypothetical protein